MTDDRSAEGGERVALKPCPFCGHGDTQIVENGRVWTGQKWGDPTSVSIRHWCPAVPGQPSRLIERVGRDEASAVEAWNLRAALAAQEAGAGRDCDQCIHRRPAPVHCARENCRQRIDWEPDPSAAALKGRAAELCCQSPETCDRPCVPRGRWLAQHEPAAPATAALTDEQTDAPWLEPAWPSNDQVYDLLGDLADVSTHDINLRDHNEAWLAVARFVSSRPVAPAMAALSEEEICRWADFVRDVAAGKPLPAGPKI